MSNEAEYNYVQHMNILHGSCEVIDVPRLVSECTEDWYNQTLCKVNESVVRLGVLHGEYHWHKHEDDDEFFFVLSGCLEIEVEGGSTVRLDEHEGYVVPKGMMHRPLAPSKTVVLMVETASIDPKGTSPA
ncbi:MAG: cupin domain-containing protein [Phycisphaerales bacterium JB043]